MGNILEKLGIYDLFVIFLSGAIITYVTSLVYEKFFINKFPVSVDETMSFLILSFFVGTIFQELSSYIFRNFFNKNRRILEEVFANANDKSISIIKAEKIGLLLYFNRKSINDREMMYNYCKYKLLRDGVSISGDINQSISSLSRSLCLYFFCLWIFLLINTFPEFNKECFVYLIICSFLIKLFYIRCIRFIKVRYVNILRMFYYKYVINKE